MAKFKISDIFFLKSKNSLFIIGEIVDGRIKIGMSFNLEEKQFLITGIEFWDRILNKKMVSKVALSVIPDEKSFFENILQKEKSKSIEIEISHADLKNK